MTRIYCAGLGLLIGSIVPLQRCSAQSLGWQTISGVPGCFTVKTGDNGKTFSASSGSGTLDGKVFSSTDFGQAWYPTTIDYGVILEISAKGPNIIVSRTLGTGRSTYQVFLSTDNGFTWQGILSTDPGVFPVSGFMYSDQGEIYGVLGFGSDAQLAKRNGQRWDPIGLTIPPVSFRLFPFPGSFVPPPTAIDRDDRIYVGTVNDGLFITTNYGTTWRNALPQTNVTAFAVPSPTIVVVATSPNLIRNGGIFVSADSGQTWTFLGLSDMAISSVSVDNANGIYAATANGIFKYGGAPNSWINISPVPGAFSGITAPQPNVVIAASTSNGVFASTDDGATWQRGGITKEDISAILVTPQQVIIAGTYGDRLFRSTNAGGSWAQITSGLRCENIYALAMIDAVLFAAADCGIFVSPDEGIHWLDVSHGYISGGGFSLLNDGRGNIYAGTNFGIYRSADSGKTWRQSGLISSKVTGLALTGSGEIIAMTASSGLYKSADGGSSWMSIGLVRDDLQSVATNSGQDIFVGGAGGVYVSTDDGNSWSYRDFSGSFVYSLLFRDASTIVAGTGTGVYISINEGQTWVPRSGGLGQKLVLSLGVDNQGYVYAGSYHGGASRSSQPLTSVESSGTIPLKPALSRNYPNPFNPRTTIEFQLVHPGRANLDVFNVLGQRVATLLNGYKTPGVYRLQWDGGGQPSGLYFYRLTASGFVETRKMLLLR